MQDQAEQVTAENATGNEGDASGACNCGTVRTLHHHKTSTSLVGIIKLCFAAKLSTETAEISVSAASICNTIAYAICLLQVSNWVSF